MTEEWWKEIFSMDSDDTENQSTTNGICSSIERCSYSDRTCVHLKCTVVRMYFVVCTCTSDWRSLADTLYTKVGTSRLNSEKEQHTRLVCGCGTNCINLGMCRRRKLWPAIRTVAVAWICTLSCRGLGYRKRGITGACVRTFFSLSVRILRGMSFFFCTVCNQIDELSVDEICLVIDCWDDVTT